MSLMSDLNALKLAHHVEEDDNWYSCPKSGQCSRENVDACDCGANKHNTKVSLLQARLAPIREVWEKYNPHDGSYWADALAYGSSDRNMQDVFHECWHAIRKVMEDQP